MLEKDGLELDGMLTAVNQLVVEELSPGGPGNLLHVVAIGLHEPQRRLEVFEGQRESAAAILMSDPQDYECVDAWLLRQGAIRPGVNRSAAAKINVRAEHAAKPPVAGRAFGFGGANSSVCVCARYRRCCASRALKIARELVAQESLVRGVRSPGQRCGSPRRPAVRIQKRGERGTVKHHRLLELGNQPLESLRIQRLSGLALNPTADFLE